MEMPELKSDEEIEKWANSKGFDISKYLDVHLEQCKKMRNWAMVNKFKRDSIYRDSFYKKFLDKDKGEYIDPDQSARRRIAGYDCLADGLHSLHRIACGSARYEPASDIVDVYDHYRKVPIFYFPPKRYGHNGINVGRSLWEGQDIEPCLNGGTYSDRIDLFLFDLKMWFKYHYEKNDDDKADKICKMSKFYLDEVTHTKEWLDALYEQGGFEYLMDEVYDVRGVFVNDNCDVINIETGELITEDNWKSIEGEEWTKDFYGNLKTTIDEWYRRQGLLRD